MDIGIVIVNWNVRDLLRACLESVFLELAQSRLSAHVVVVDNASHDGSVDMVRAEFPRVQVIAAENRGMGAGNNEGLWALGYPAYQSPLRPLPPVEPPDFALILNPDTLIRPRALRLLVDFMRANPQVGVAAPKLLNADGSLQHAGFRFPGLVQGFFDLFPPPRRLAWLTNSPLNGRYAVDEYGRGDPFPVQHTLGAAFVVRREALTRRPLFDEAYTLYCEELDAHKRLRAEGWQIWLVPGAEIVHFGGQSTAQAPTRSFVQLWASRKRFYQRYHGPLTNTLMRWLVTAAMRARIRENYRLAQAGRLSVEERATRNAMLSEVIQVWHTRRVTLAG